jgi:hypothetical protein
MRVKEFYTKKYPTDNLGVKICDSATFAGMLDCIIAKQCIYTYIGVSDSLVRERLFEKLATILEVSYDTIYGMWTDAYEDVYATV